MASQGSDCNHYILHTSNNALEKAKPAESFKMKIYEALDRVYKLLQAPRYFGNPTE